MLTSLRKTRRPTALLAIVVLLFLGASLGIAAWLVATRDDLDPANRP